VGVRANSLPAQPSSVAAKGNYVVGTLLALACETVVLWFGVAWVGVEAVTEYRSSLNPHWVWPGVAINETQLGNASRAELRSVLEKIAADKVQAGVEMRSGGRARKFEAQALGLKVPIENSAHDILAFGRSGNLLRDIEERARALREGQSFHLAATFDEAAALSALQQERDFFAIPQISAQIDLDRRMVVAGSRAERLDPAANVINVAFGLANGADRIDLETFAYGQDVRQPSIEQADLAVTLAAYETSFSSTTDALDRIMNLRIAASALDGVVLAPGETLSFNERVGERSSELGYRNAPGIQAGELIDVVGGGVCQVASTLFASAMLGGLDIIKASPHSRPSSYIELGLDTTVVWPTVDLQVRNPYPFRIVLHTRVQEGKVRVELLGREPGYRVVFGRTISGQSAYSRIERHDSKLALGQTEIKQRGRNGYFVTRTRSVYKTADAQPEVSRWELTYPPTDEIVLIGSAAKGREARDSLPAKGTPPLEFSLENAGSIAASEG
jgi:vancomycin resistance protein YoaR